MLPYSGVLSSLVVADKLCGQPIRVRNKKTRMMETEANKISKPNDPDSGFKKTLHPSHDHAAGNAATSNGGRSSLAHKRATVTGSRSDGDHHSCEKVPYPQII